MLTFSLQHVTGKEIMEICCHKMFIEKWGLNFGDTELISENIYVKVISLACYLNSNNGNLWP